MRICVLGELNTICVIMNYLVITITTITTLFQKAFFKCHQYYKIETKTQLKNYDCHEVKQMDILFSIPLF